MGAQAAKRCCCAANEPAGVNMLPADTVDPLVEVETQKTLDGMREVEAVSFTVTQSAPKEKANTDSTKKEQPTYEPAEPTDVEPETPEGHPPRPRLTHQPIKGIAKYNGYWMQLSDESGIAHIDNGILRWRLSDEYHEQGDVKVTLNADGELVLPFGGETLTGDLMNGMIVWSDGDTWQYDPNAESKVQYNGDWYEDEAFVAHIWDAKVTWHGDYLSLKTELKVADSGKLEMRLSDQMHTGEIIDGALVWSDGTKWTRKPGSQ